MSPDSGWRCRFLSMRPGEPSVPAYLTGGGPCAAGRTAGGDTMDAHDRGRRRAKTASGPPRRHGGLCDRGRPGPPGRGDRRPPAPARSAAQLAGRVPRHRPAAGASGRDPASSSSAATWSPPGAPRRPARPGARTHTVTCEAAFAAFCARPDVPGHRRLPGRDRAMMRAGRCPGRARRVECARPRSTSTARPVRAPAPCWCGPVAPARRQRPHADAMPDEDRPWLVGMERLEDPAPGPPLRHLAPPVPPAPALPVGTAAGARRARPAPADRVRGRRVGACVPLAAPAAARSSTPTPRPGSPASS